MIRQIRFAVCLLSFWGLVLTAGMPAMAMESSAKPPEGKLDDLYKQKGIAAETIWMPMRDGTRLAATYAKPFLGSKFPTILVRTPYGRDDDAIELVATLVPLYGYAVIIQDMRGRGDSEGEDRVFQDDGWGENQDGYDSVEWIAEQSWSNGKIGSFGPSALGIVQGLMAGTAPPHLTCQAITYAASKGYGQAAYQGGVFRKALVNGWLGGQGSLHMLPEFLAHPTDDAFWNQYDIESHHTSVNAPTLFMGGLYDCFLQGTINDFTGRQLNGAEGARGNNHMILGPWTHTNETGKKQGQLSYPGNSVIELLDQVSIVLEWFDYWMKGSDNDAMDGDPVEFYLMGDVTDEDAPGNEWRTSPTWPPAGNEAVLYLHADGSLDAVRPIADGGATMFNFDPADPVPTMGGGNLEIDAGPYDQSAVEARSDVITFSSGPLTAPLEVAGGVKALIYASSNLEDMDISVRLSDVYPDGRSMLLCDGILRASFRDGFTENVPIEAGQVYRYEIDLWATAIAFQTGHQIRAAIANANYPRFDLNPAYEAGSIVETIVYHDAERPSALLLNAIAPEPGQHPLLPLDADVADWAVY